jgi:quercetin dioxygenase-like cupin family protein
MRIIAPALVLAFAACTVSPIQPPAAPAPAPATTPAQITVGRTMAAPVPAARAVTRTTIYQSDRTVAQVLRLAPGGNIAEHHHPVFDESFVVTQGHIALSLNGVAYELTAGEFIVMPAGTVISGANVGSGEAVVVVTFSGNGNAGPFSVPGAMRH